VEQDDFSYSLSDSDDDDDDDWHDGAHDDMLKEDHDDGDHDDDDSLSDSDDDDDDWHDGAHEDTLLEDDGNDDDYSMSESGSSSNWYYGAHTAIMKATGHNCLTTAGYEWCKEKKKCLRRFEEYCPSLTMSPTPQPDDGPWAPPKPGSGSARVKPTDKTEGGFVKYVFNTDDSKSSFAYRRISCDDADLCEIKCNGKFSCYKTKIDAKSAIQVTVKCNGMGACWDMDFRNTEGAREGVDIYCEGRGACLNLMVDVDDTDLMVKCTNGECMGCDLQAKVGGCDGMTINYFGQKKVDKSNVINRDGTLDLKCEDSSEGMPSCKDVVASCPNGAHSCSIDCGYNACDSMQVYLGRVAKEHGVVGVSYDDVALTCAREETSCKDVTISCVEEEKVVTLIGGDKDWPTSDLSFGVSDDGYVGGKKWFCDGAKKESDGCCPYGLSTA